MTFKLAIEIHCCEQHESYLDQFLRAKQVVS